VVGTNAESPAVDTKHRLVAVIPRTSLEAMQRQLSYDPFDIHESDVLPPGRDLPNAVLDLFERHRYPVIDDGTRSPAV
jgi:hypothetical protein